MVEERLQKVLAQQGLGSRREIEGWIEAGRVVVNGKIATLGVKVTEKDKIIVDGKPVKLQEREEFIPRVIMLNKAEGQICSRNDPEHKRSVFDQLPKIHPGRWVMVGRLDINTTGLLLFTNDGELANRLMHPSYEIDREYAVRVLGEVKPEHLKNLTRGVELEDGLAKFDQIVDAGGTGSNHWYHVMLQEGKNREVRRLWESQDLQVSRLTRIRYGCITLPRDLPRGAWRELDQVQLVKLLELVNLKRRLTKPAHPQVKRPTTRKPIRKRKK